MLKKLSILFLSFFALCLSLQLANAALIQSVEQFTLTVTALSNLTQAQIEAADRLLIVRAAGSGQSGETKLQTQISEFREHLIENAPQGNRTAATLAHTQLIPLSDGYSIQAQILRDYFTDYPVNGLKTAAELLESDLVPISGGYSLPIQALTQEGLLVATEAQLTTAIAASTPYIIVNDTITLTADKNLASSRSQLSFNRTGKIVTAGHVLTLYTPIPANIDWQIFDTAAGEVVLPAASKVNVDWFYNGTPASIYAAIRSVAATGKLHMTMGAGKTYIAAGYGFYIKDFESVNIEGNWAILSGDPTLSVTGAGPVYIENSSNITIRNLIVDGNRDEVLDSLDGACSGITLLGCTNVLLEGFRIDNARTDGIYLGDYSGTQCSQVVIKRGVVNYSRRNGIAVVTASNVAFEDIEINNAGQNIGLSTGTLPKVAVDLEPNVGDPANDGIRFARVRMVSTASHHVSIAGSAGSNNLEFVSCNFGAVAGCGIYALAPASGASLNTVTGMKIHDCVFNGAGISHATNVAWTDVDISTNTFKDISCGTNGGALVIAGTGKVHWRFHDNIISGDGRFMSVLPTLSADNLTSIHSFECYNNKYYVTGNASLGSSVESGTTDGDGAHTLIQSGQNFTSTVTVGDLVHNSTAGTYALVTTVVDDNTLYLSDDIIDSGQSFTVYDTLYPIGYFYGTLRDEIWIRSGESIPVEVRLHTAYARVANLQTDGIIQVRDYDTAFIYKRGIDSLALRKRPVFTITSIPMGGSFGANARASNFNPTVDGNNMLLWSWIYASSAWRPVYLSTVSPAN